VAEVNRRGFLARLGGAAVAVASTPLLKLLPAPTPAVLTYRGVPWRTSEYLQGQTVIVTSLKVKQAYERLLDFDRRYDRELRAGGMTYGELTRSSDAAWRIP
jgi:hypothetical protein